MSEPALPVRSSQLLESIGAVYDHVAHAVPSIRDALPVYVGLLGGRPILGAINARAGIAVLHIEFAPGIKVEVVEPVQPDSPAIGSFLAQRPRGGLHHMTFRVTDFPRALERVTRLGLSPIGVHTATEWPEMFVHPRETGGLLLQIVQYPAGAAIGPGMPVDELLAEAERLRGNHADSWFAV
jgi:methylmalonyl-CoA/ethylmalonyl-CoA epimerase